MKHILTVAIIFLFSISVYANDICEDQKDGYVRIDLTEGNIHYDFNQELQRVNFMIVCGATTFEGSGIPIYHLKGILPGTCANLNIAKQKIYITCSLRPRLNN